MSGPGRPLVVGQRGPVGGADLADPGPGGLQQVGQAEPVADLDQLAAADDDLASRGQRGGGQGQRGCVVVDHVHGPGRRNRLRERVQGPGPAAAALAGDQVQLHVGVPGGGDDGVARRGRQRRPAEVGVHDHAGSVDHRGERRRGRGQRRRRRVGHVVRADGPRAGQVLGPGHRLLHQRRTEQVPRRDQPRVGQHHIGSWHVPPRVHTRDPTAAAHARPDPAWRRHVTPVFMIQ